MAALKYANHLHGKAYVLVTWAMQRYGQFTPRVFMVSELGKCYGWPTLLHVMLAQAPV
jgi:hypothetical protein